MTIDHAATTTADALEPEDRHHGRVALNLVGAWDDWVKRRVETVELLSDTTVRRRVSVDFRMRSWLPAPVLQWDGSQFHYIPIAQLEKGRMLRFDLRDETGRALPLLTRRKNAMISAATLAALAQFTIWTELEKFVTPDVLKSGLSHPPDPLLIRIPRAIEDDFVRIAYLSYRSKSGEQSSRAVLDAFLDKTPTSLIPLRDWSWEKVGDEWRFDDEALWRVELARDVKVRRMLADLAQQWLVSVPIKHEPCQRRIVKFSYLEVRKEPQLTTFGRLKDKIDAKGIGKRLEHIEDRLEGLPHDQEGEREWALDHSPHRWPTRISATTKIRQALGWEAHVVVLDAPAIGKGGSYHLQLDAPAGTQIRRATLSAVQGNVVRDGDAVRGARSLQHAHLHLGHVPAGVGRGFATLALKARASTMVRGLALLSVGAFLMLIAARWKLDALTTRTHGNSGNLAPVFLLFPGLAAVAIARGTEHSMTTTMLFGTRILAIGVAFCPLAGASLLAIARFWPHIGIAWWGLVFVSGALMLALLVAWRLAGRRRPGGDAP